MAAPLASVTAPQLPTPSVVFHSNRAGSGVPQVQVLAGVHWQEASQSVPAPHCPWPQGGSHCSPPVTWPSPQTDGHAAVRGTHLMVNVSSSLRGLVPLGARAVTPILALPGAFGRPFLASFTGIVPPDRAPQVGPSSDGGLSTSIRTLPRGFALTSSRPLGGVHPGALASVWLMQSATCTSHWSSPQGPVSQGSPSVQRTILFFSTRSLGFRIPATSISA
jgi:hypothetical protein